MNQLRRSVRLLTSAATEHHPFQMRFRLPSTLLLHKSCTTPHLSFLSPCCESQNLHQHGERIQERGNAHSK